MISGFDKEWVLLANGDWGRLVGLIVVFGFYVVSAIFKKVSEGSENKKASKTSYLVELAKKRAKEKAAAKKHTPTALETRLAQARREREMAGKRGPLSEWDRLQERKRHMHAKQPEVPVQVPVIEEVPTPPPIQAQITPQYMAVPSEQKARRRYQIPQPVPQKKAYIQPPNFIPAEPKRKYVSRPKPKKIREVATPATPVTRPLDIFLRSPNELRSAIILKEILDKPLGLREDVWAY